MRPEPPAGALRALYGPMQFSFANCQRDRAAARPFASGLQHDVVNEIYVQAQ